MKHRTVEQAGSRKQERGSILATSAIGMLAILLAVGLGIDISRFYLVKAELQNGADAAALAAVSVLNGAPSGINAAVQEATTKTTNKYNFNNAGITITDIQFSASLNSGYMPAVAAAAPGTAPNIRYVRVTTEPSPVAVSFAVSVLGASKDLTATATAGYSVGLTDICNFLPVMVIDYGPPNVISPGMTYTFRAEGGSFVSPGNYQILALAGAGGADARVGLAAGVDACAGPGAEYAIDTKPGVTAGAVRQGVNTRFDEYQTSAVNPQDHPPDTNIKEGITYDQYLSGKAADTKAPSHPGIAKRRVVYIPIVKESEFDPGRKVVKFNRIGQFFLQTKVGGGSGGELKAEYIEDITVGIGTVGSGGGGSPLTVTPVLYK